MIITLLPLLGTSVAVSTEINLWSIIIPIIITALTSGIISLGTRFLDRNKNKAEEKKLTAEEKKIQAETSHLENSEWQTLFAEMKAQKKESDDELALFKRQSEEQMASLKKQVSIHSDTLEVQASNFETQEETIQQLKTQLQEDKIAITKLESIIKKFQQWAVRNRAELELSKTIEPIPAEVMYY
jgi:hypothetical protein